MKKILIPALLISALFLRFFLSINSKHGDMYNNWDWGEGMWKYGISHIYDVPQHTWPHSWPNQPPGSLYLHALSFGLFTGVSQASDYLNLHLSIFPSRFIWWWPINGPLIALKLPSIIADFVIAWVLYKFGVHWGRPKWATFVAFVYLFNPALWYNSGFWGQTDSIVACLSLLSIYFLIKNKLWLSPIFLGLSLITKASWAPIVPLYLLYWWSHYEKEWPKLFLAPLTFFALAFPFHLSLNSPIWFSRLFLTRIVTGESSWITVIAFNFWNLFFASSYTPVDIPILGVPAIYLAWTIVGVFVLSLLRKNFKNSSSKHFVYSAALLFFIIFLFAPKMLQRYFYPFFPLFSVFLIYSKNKFYWFIYGLVSACYLINLYYLWWAPGIPALEKYYTPLFTHVISIIYLTSFAFLYVKKTD